MVSDPKLKVITDEDTTSDNVVPPNDAAAPTPKDARDIEALWDDPGLGDGLTVTSMHSIPIDKPKNFFRVHPDPAYRRRTEMYIHKVEGEIEKSYYILGEKMKGRLEEARHCVIVTCIYRDGSLRLWPIPLPRDGEKDNRAWASARVAARTAMSKWVKLVWVGGSYQTRDAKPGYAPDPNWGKLPPYNDLVETAFSAVHGFMDDEDHAVYRDHLAGAPPSNNDDDDI
jgi:hypothetical protein